MRGMTFDYREYGATGLAASFVQCYWTLDGVAAAAVQPERVIPDGRPELVWNLAAPFLRHVEGSAPRRQSAELLVGQITAPIRLEPTGAIRLVGVRFRPEGLAPLLGGLPVAELTDADVSADDLLGRRLAGFAERLHAAADAATRIRTLDSMLCDVLRRVPAVDPRLAAAAHMIAAGRGQARTDVVAAAACVSVRQLQRMFDTGVGVGPKRLARITRFQHLLTTLAGAPVAGWASLAAACGYADQSHLIRDFREFTGAPPGEFVVGGRRHLMEVFLRAG
jgi:AraC-like DNA-binding protein